MSALLSLLLVGQAQTPLPTFMKPVSAQISATTVPFTIRSFTSRLDRSQQESTPGVDPFRKVIFLQELLEPKQSEIKEGTLETEPQVLPWQGQVLSSGMPVLAIVSKACGTIPPAQVLAGEKEEEYCWVHSRTYSSDKSSSVLVPFDLISPDSQAAVVANTQQLPQLPWSFTEETNPSVFQFLA